MQSRRVKERKRVSVKIHRRYISSLTVRGITPGWISASWTALDPPSVFFHLYTRPRHRLCRPPFAHRLPGAIRVEERGNPLAWTFINGSTDPTFIKNPQSWNPFRTPSSHLHLSLSFVSVPLASVHRILPFSDDFTFLLVPLSPSDRSSALRLPSPWSPLQSVLFCFSIKPRVSPLGP